MTTVEKINVISIGQTSMASELERAGYKKMGVHVQSTSTFQAAYKVIQEGKADILVMSADDPCLLYTSDAADE